MVTYAVTYEGKAHKKWVVRRNGVALLKTPSDDRMERFVLSKSRSEAAESGKPVRVVVPTGDVLSSAKQAGFLDPAHTTEHVWTPGSTGEEVRCGKG